MRFEHTKKLKSKRKFPFHNEQPNDETAEFGYLDETNDNTVFKHKMLVPFAGTATTPPKAVKGIGTLDFGACYSYDVPGTNMGGASMTPLPAKFSQPGKNGTG